MEIHKCFEVFRFFFASINLVATSLLSPTTALSSKAPLMEAQCATPHNKNTPFPAYGGISPRIAVLAV